MTDQYEPSLRSSASANSSRDVLVLERKRQTVACAMEWCWKNFEGCAENYRTVDSSVHTANRAEVLERLKGETDDEVLHSGPGCKEVEWERWAKHRPDVCTQDGALHGSTHDSGSSFQARLSIFGWNAATAETDGPLSSEFMNGAFHAVIGEKVGQLIKKMQERFFIVRANEWGLVVAFRKSTFNRVTTLHWFIRRQRQGKRGGWYHLSALLDQFGHGDAKAAQRPQAPLR